MKPVKVGFVLLSNSQNPVPSTRIAVLNMLPFLRAANFDPHIVFEPAHATETPDMTGMAQRLLEGEFRLVFFQKVRGPSVEELVLKLSASGVRTVYLVCDLVDARMAAITDATLAVTDYLKRLYPVGLQSKIHVVHDGIELPNVRKADVSIHPGSPKRPLHAVLVTSAKLDQLPAIGTLPEWLELTIVGRYPPVEQTMQRLRQARWALANQKNMRERFAYMRFLGNPRIRCIPWDAVGVYEKLREADIGIIPIERSPEHNLGTPPPSWKVKSENRLTMKMCVGLPVIATPIPAYEPVIEQGKNGFLAGTQQEWRECLEALRDPVLRRVVGARARESVLKRYSMQEQARYLLAVLRNLIGSHVGSSRETTAWR